jgi:hypothetical protein
MPTADAVRVKTATHDATGPIWRMVANLLGIVLPFLFVNRIVV